jgi:hypothetical protein
MNVGLWMAPAGMVSPLVILWAATWLERLVAPTVLELPMRQTADGDFTGAAGPELSFSPRHLEADGPGRHSGTSVDGHVVQGWSL